MLSPTNIIRVKGLLPSENGLSWRASISLGTITGETSTDMTEPYTVDIVNPVGPEDQKTLKWYLDKYSKKGSSNGLRAKEAEMIFQRCGDSLCTQLKKAIPSLDSLGVNIDKVEISSDPRADSIHRLHWETMAYSFPKPVSVYRSMPGNFLNRDTKERQGHHINVLFHTSRVHEAEDIDPYLILHGLSQTLAELAKHMSPASIRELVRIRVVRPGTFEAFKDALESKAREGERYNIIHLDTHGVIGSDAQGVGSNKTFSSLKFVLDSPDLDTYTNIDCKTLGEVLRGHGPDAVFLNACHSASATSKTASLAPSPEANLAFYLLRNGIPVVLGMSYRITASAVRIFFTELYLCYIGRGLDVLQSVMRARDALFKNIERQTQFKNTLCIRDWAIPVLYTQDPGSRLSLLQRPNHELSFPEIETSLADNETKRKLDSIWLHDGYIGRSFDHLKLDSCLAKHRRVELYGDSGIGKTELVRNAMAYWGRLGIFKHIIFVQASTQLQTGVSSGEKTTINLSDAFAAWKPLGIPKYTALECQTGAMCGVETNPKATDALVWIDDFDEHYLVGGGQQILDSVLDILKLLGHGCHHKAFLIMSHSLVCDSHTALPKMRAMVRSWLSHQLQPPFRLRLPGLRRQDAINLATTISEQLDTAKLTHQDRVLLSGIVNEVFDGNPWCIIKAMQLCARPPAGFTNCWFALWIGRVICETRNQNDISTLKLDHKISRIRSSCPSQEDQLTLLCSFSRVIPDWVVKSELSRTLWAELLHHSLVEPHPDNQDYWRISPALPLALLRQAITSNRAEEARRRFGNIYRERIRTVPLTGTEAEIDYWNILIAFMATIALSTPTSEAWSAALQMRKINTLEGMDKIPIVKMFVYQMDEGILQDIITRLHGVRSNLVEFRDCHGSYSVLRGFAIAAVDIFTYRSEYMFDMTTTKTSALRALDLWFKVAADLPFDIEHLPSDEKDFPSGERLTKLSQWFIFFQRGFWLSLRSLRYIDGNEMAVKRLTEAFWIFNANPLPSVWKMKIFASLLIYSGQMQEGLLLFEVLSEKEREDAALYGLSNPEMDDRPHLLKRCYRTMLTSLPRALLSANTDSEVRSTAMGAKVESDVELSLSDDEIDRYFVYLILVMNAVRERDSQKIYNYSLDLLKASESRQYHSEENKYLDQAEICRLLGITSLKVAPGEASQYLRESINFLSSCSTYERLDPMFFCLFVCHVLNCAVEMGGEPDQTSAEFCCINKVPQEGLSYQEMIDLLTYSYSKKQYRDPDEYWKLLISSSADGYVEWFQIAQITRYQKHIFGCDNDFFELARRGSFTYNILSYFVYDFQAIGSDRLMRDGAPEVVAYLEEKIGWGKGQLSEHLRLNVLPRYRKLTCGNECMGNHFSRQAAVADGANEKEDRLLNFFLEVELELFG